MSVPAVSLAVSQDAWLAEVARGGDFVEIVDGEFVVKRVGGNPHHYLARRLAEEFERQWAGSVATAPGNWALTGEPTALTAARMPDVLVAGDELLRDPVYYGQPLAAVEVWSPSNTLGEMNDKRRLYREAGLPVFVEVFISDSGDVHMEWLANERRAWLSVATAVGETDLVVAGPRSFRVTPNSLLRRSAVV